MRFGVNFGLRIADKKHMPGGVFARHGGHAAGEIDEAQNFIEGGTVDIDQPAKLLFEMGRAAHIHPQDRVTEGFALLVDRNRALALRG